MDTDDTPAHPDRSHSSTSPTPTTAVIPGRPPLAGWRHLPDAAAAKASTSTSPATAGSARRRHPKRKFTLKTGTIFEDSAARPRQVASGRLDDRQHEERRQLARTGALAWRHAENRVVHAPAHSACHAGRRPAASSAAKSRLTKPSSAARPATCTQRSAARHRRAGRDAARSPSWACWSAIAGRLAASA